MNRCEIMMPDLLKKSAIDDSDAGASIEDSQDVGVIDLYTKKKWR